MPQKAGRDHEVDRVQNHDLGHLGGAVHRVLIIQREKVRMIRIWKRKELKIKKSEVLNGRKKRKKKRKNK